VVARDREAGAPAESVVRAAGIPHAGEVASGRGRTASAGLFPVPIRSPEASAVIDWRCGPESRRRG
jgi:hypothetical protein